MYQSLRVGIAVAGHGLHLVEGVAGGTGQLVHGAGLHCREGQVAVLYVVIEVDDGCAECVLLKQCRHDLFVGCALAGDLCR